MGDRTYTSIQFSGCANIEVAEGLIEELEGQHCQPDSGRDNGEITVEMLSETSFYDEECNYGQMEGVEGFCRENGISYLKTWGSGGGYGAGYLLYNAVVDQDFEVPGDDEPCLGISELRKLAKDGKTIDDVVNYLDAINNFEKHYPPLEIRGSVTEGERQ